VPTDRREGRAIRENLYFDQSVDYARFRPGYPESLFDYLASLCRGRRLAWDCGTGTGQAAVPLAGRFDRVEATDASPEQIDRAVARPNVTYRVAAAEDSGLEAASVDLVTMAQALHWFSLDRTWGEVRRVVRPDGVVAAWCYTFPRIDARVDPVFSRFHGVTLGGCWPPARRHVDRGYRDLEFPFQELRPPEFRMQERWTLDRFLGYLGSWSAVRVFRQRHGSDPVARVRPDLERAWGRASDRRMVEWTIHLRVGRR
jgi:SAM-dependent methyltransferase